jgi:methionine-gamma-lyase
MSFDPGSNIQDYLVFGEYGDVNPSITDSSTYTFLNPNTMEEVFQHEIEGCYLYSRHWNPSNRYLAKALARMEDSEFAHVTASGMSAIAVVVMQLCQAKDEIVCSRTIYGGTYALFKNFLPKFGVSTRFVDITDLAAVEAAITANTKILYFESISNPLLEVADIRALSKIARQHNVTMVVDNTFSPMIISPIRLGADIVVHSMTKFINGTSDCVAGCICGSEAFINSISDVNNGANMLLGPVLDSIRAASILKNLHSLHLRMEKHSANALYLAEQLSALGVKVHYPGLPTHPQHQLIKQSMNPQFGFGGMLVIDMDTTERANAFMVAMQEEKVGYLAVSLGYFKTLFSSPGHSTSSEIPAEEREAIGLTDGLVRMSVGLDSDIKRTFQRIKKCLKKIGKI